MPELPLRVAVVSSVPIVEAGVRSLLARRSDVVTVVEPVHPDGGVPEVDAVVYDLHRLGESPAELERMVRSSRVVVGIAGPGREELVEVAESAGITVRMLHDTTLDDLLAALTSATAQSPPDPGLRLSPVTPGGADLHPLGAREASIIELVAEGFSNQEIASHLYLSVNTIKTYLRTAYAKIGVRNRAQAVSWYLRRANSGARR